jgi:lipoprotein-anchoring transpeptidase ErfK/SrfK
MRLKTGILITAGFAVLALSLATIVTLPSATLGGETVIVGQPESPTRSDVPTVSAAPYAAPTAVQVAALPEAKYDAVIPGLIAYTAVSAPEGATTAYTLSSDTVIYGADHSEAVARFAATNFLGEKSVVVPVAFDGSWALVLTPARQALPSVAPGNAPAQTAGWVRAERLTKDHPLTHRINVSVKDQTLTIVDATGAKTASFSVGVGTPSTPTPTGVTGYVQARYLDPAQGQRTYPIQLSSLHSAAADEPYGGNDGGLIGVHHYFASNGAVSHGCIRLPKEAIIAVNQLPVGTLISITN